MAEPNRFWVMYRYGEAVLFYGNRFWHVHVEKADTYSFSEANTVRKALGYAPGTLSSYSVEPVSRAVAKPDEPSRDTIGSDD